ncbi:MAG: sugar phosphate isomerase/epimerase [Candidatus Micrarchaeota archaeon]|nr:sugar phosphate isomerase/epimerase [Candidatus Micrarchaeota archaeon]
MIIGAMNSPKKELAAEIELFGEMNFDFVEITIEAPGATPEKIGEKKKAILDALHSYNFGVLAHLPWYFSVAHPYARIQKAILEESVRAFDAAVLLGAKKATVHTEFLPAGLQDRAVHVAKTIETVKSLQKEASNRGIELLVENYLASSFSIKEFKLLFSEVDAKMTLDVGHAEAKDGEGVGSFISAFKGKVAHVHLHDNDKKGDLHLPLGAGKIDLPRCIKELKSFYNGTITLEVHSEDRDYLRLSREKLEVMWFGKAHHQKNKEYQGAVGGAGR